MSRVRTWSPESRSFEDLTGNHWLCWPLEPSASLLIPHNRPHETLGNLPRLQNLKIRMTTLSDPYHQGYSPGSENLLLFFYFPYGINSCKYQDPCWTSYFCQDFLLPSLSVSVSASSPPYCRREACKALEGSLRQQQTMLFQKTEFLYYLLEVVLVISFCPSCSRAGSWCLNSVHPCPQPWYFF